MGRTARIGQQGSALLFLQPSELGFLDVLRSRNLTDLREMQLEERLRPQDLTSLLLPTACYPRPLQHPSLSNGCVKTLKLTEITVLFIQKG